MIRSIPTPPMAKEDVQHFRKNLIKHLTRCFSKKEWEEIERINSRTAVTAKTILENCGGKNPLLGH
ncbi:MAG: hypothetical protein K2M11_00610 [Paramuribaculum sp.]|nr:hypothetical protein [Paramuribaculum sp.]